MGRPSRSSPAGDGGVHVSVDYSSFAFADDGDYASRLHLVELPACALTTPQLAACRRQASLASADDVSDFRLGADVTVPAWTGTRCCAGTGRGDAGVMAVVAAPAVPGSVKATATAATAAAATFRYTPLPCAGFLNIGA